MCLSAKPKICTKTQFHKQVGGELGGGEGMINDGGADDGIQIIG